LSINSSAVGIVFAKKVIQNTEKARELLSNKTERLYKRWGDF